jgi:hypothetical protein
VCTETPPRPEIPGKHIKSEYSVTAQSSSSEVWSYGCWVQGLDGMGVMRQVCTCQLQLHLSPVRTGAG